jgi:hypothetical protein
MKDAASLHHKTVQFTILCCILCVLLTRSGQKSGPNTNLLWWWRHSARRVGDTGGGGRIKYTTAATSGGCFVGPTFGRYTAVTVVYGIANVVATVYTTVVQKLYPTRYYYCCCRWKTFHKSGFIFLVKHDLSTTTVIWRQNKKRRDTFVRRLKKLGVFFITYSRHLTL